MDIEVVRHRCGKKLPELKNLRTKSTFLWLVSVENELFEKTNNNTGMRTSWYVPQYSNYLFQKGIRVLYDFSGIILFYLSRINLAVPWHPRGSMITYLTRRFKKRLFISWTKNLLGFMISQVGIPTTNTIP